VTEGGLFVGLTNQRGHAGKGPAARSRGEVVLRCLEAGSVEEVERYLAGLNPGEYHPFNLLYGTAEVLRVAYVRSESRRVEPREVPVGVHVLPNDELDTEALPKVGRLWLRAEPLARLEGEELLRALQELLADHVQPEVHAGLMSFEDPPEVREWARQLQALCIHTPAYGTRSSAIVALEPGRVARYLASDAPPCQGPFRDMTGLVYLG
jgi:uncharacterized protein with NRDE domain